MKIYFYGKLCGAVSGTVLSGNLFGTLIGGLLGHFLFDVREPLKSGECENIEDYQYISHTNTLEAILKICIMLMDKKNSLFFKDIELIKNFFIEQFRFDLNDIIVLDNTIYKIIDRKQEININLAVSTINCYCPYQEKLSILQLLFLLVTASKKITPEEKKYIHDISARLEIKSKEFNVIYNHFCEETVDLYGVFGLTRDATNGEIKSAYRRLVAILHPDSAGEQYDKEKFQTLVKAYEEIKKIRNIN